MKIVQFMIAAIFVFYNVKYQDIFNKSRSIEIDTNFNRITLSVLLLAFIFEALNSGKVGLKAYIVNINENKKIFYAVILIYMACILLLLSGIL